MEAGHRRKVGRTFWDLAFIKIWGLGLTTLVVVKAITWAFFSSKHQSFCPSVCTGECSRELGQNRVKSVASRAGVSWCLEEDKAYWRNCVKPTNTSCTSYQSLCFPVYAEIHSWLRKIVPSSASTPQLAHPASKGWFCSIFKARWFRRKWEEQYPHIFTYSGHFLMELLSLSSPLGSLSGPFSKQCRTIIPHLSFWYVFSPVQMWFFLHLSQHIWSIVPYFWHHHGLRLHSCSKESGLRRILKERRVRKEVCHT